MESKNSEKIQEINIIAQKTLKKASENRNLCESFYESDTKQGTVTNTAFSLLQKQFQVFCANFVFSLFLILRPVNFFVGFWKKEFLCLLMKLPTC